MTTTSTSKRLGRYILQEPLGKGSEGRVFHAVQLNAAGPMPCVVKLANDAPLQPEGSSQFLDEARRAIRLGSCPGIVQILDADEVDGTPFFVMEYVDGTDLDRILSHRRKGDGGGLHPVETYTILKDMADALHYAHVRRKIGGESLGLVHRDIKPANTLVTFDGYTKLLDFGISTRITDQHSGRFSYGTPRYMSPEHIYGPVCPVMDIYSLGVVAWEMVEGRNFRGDTKGRDHIAHIISGTIPPLRNQDISPQLVELIESSLSFDPSDRPTAHEFSRHLTTCTDYELDPDRISVLVEETLGRSSRSRATRTIEIPAELRDEPEAPSDTTPTDSKGPREPTMLSGDDSATTAWERPKKVDDDVPVLRRKRPLARPVVSLNDNEGPTTRLQKTTSPTEVIPAPPQAPQAKRTPPTTSAPPVPPSERRPTQHDPSPPAVAHRAETIEGPTIHDGRLSTTRFVLLLIAGLLVATGLGSGVGYLLFR